MLISRAPYAVTETVTSSDPQETLSVQQTRVSVDALCVNAPKREIPVYYQN
jgi:hypothetical protein